MRRKSVNKQNAQKAITNQPDPKQPYYAEKRDYAYAELENVTTAPRAIPEAKPFAHFFLRKNPCPFLVCDC